MSSRPRTLALYADHAPLFSYLDDWLDAFTSAPQFRAEALNICQGEAFDRLRRTRNDYDLIVLLHSTNGDWLHYLRKLVPLLADRRGRLLAFVGNELNLPGWPLGDKIAVLEQIRPDWVATQLVAEAGEFLYAGCVGRGVLAVPHALNPAVFKPVVAPAARRVDIGVRSAAYPPFLGDDERTRLLALFERNPFDPPLSIDISTSERFARAEWAAFLNQSRGTVATEAGSWYLERDDRTVGEIRQWVLASKRTGFVLRSDSRLQQLAMLTPQWIRRLLRKWLRTGPLQVEVAMYDGLDFTEIHDRFFRNRPRAPVYSKCISSRHFDAIGTRTCQILLRGRYNDILRADEHYLALEPDLANADDVVRRFRDPAERDRITGAALDHVLAGHTYADRMSQIAGAVSA